LRNSILKFVNSDKQYPILAAIASGLYPLIYYFAKNYNFVNSLQHVFFFITVFIGIPLITFFIIDKIFANTYLKKWRKQSLSALNVFTFLFLLQFCLYASFSKRYTLLIILIALGFAWFLFTHLKKVIVLQFILATLGLVTLMSTIKKQLSYSSAWLEQSDDIVSVTFKKTPNVYYIQPDGYANFSELKKGYYKIDNSDFETYLTNNDFKSYLDFRSNYEATLSSNSSIFSMKHHYYSGHGAGNEVANAREIIVSNNAVLNTFKSNNYKTHFLTEYPYLMVNRPEMGYDACNFSYSEIPFIGNGLQTKKEILPDFKRYIEEDTDRSKFFFIELFNPKHISSKIKGDNVVKRHREAYIHDLKEANKALKSIIETINEKDDNALIIIMADHGGYLGMKYLQQGNEMSKDRDRLYSIFSSMLAIKWPNNVSQKYDKELHSAVNLFRIIFSYLGEDNSYLNYLENDSSYGLIKRGAPEGVYEFIDANGKVTQDFVKSLEE